MSSVPGWRSPFSYLGNSGSTQRSNRQDPGAEGKSHSFELEARIQSAVDYAVANRERFSRHSGAGSDVASSVGSNSPVREMLPLSPLPSMLQSSSNCEFRHLPFRRVGSSPGHLAAQTRPTMQPADEDSAGSIAAGTAAGWSNWGQMIPDGILCPLSLEVMVDPVFTCDGHTYERSNIEKWLGGNSTSPLTNKRLSTVSVVPNYALAKVISTWKTQRDGRLRLNAIADPIDPDNSGSRPASPFQTATSVVHEAPSVEEMDVVSHLHQSVEGLDAAIIIRQIEANMSSGHVARQGLQAIMSKSAQGHEESPAFRKSFIEAGGLDLVCAAMQAHLHDSSVQVVGCRILNSLCFSSGAVAQSEVESSKVAVDALLDALVSHGTESFVCQAACLALSQYTVVSDPSSQDEAERCASVVMRTIQVHLGDVSVVSDGVVILCKIVRCSSAWPQIVGQKGVDIVVQAMKMYEGSVDFQAHGCVFLRNITSDQRRGSKLTSIKEVVAAVTRALRSCRESAVVVASGCEALKNLIGWNSAVNDQVASEAGMYCILKGMETHRRDADVQRECFQCVHALCKGRENVRNCMAVGQCKGVSIIFKGMTAHRFNEAVTTGGLLCIADLCGSDERSNNQIGDELFVRVVTQAMEDHVESVDVQCAGCVILGHLAFDDEYEKMIVEIGGSKLVIAAMTENINDAELQEAATAALKNMTCANTNKADIATQGGIQAIVATMSTHVRNRVIQEHGLWAIANLAGHNGNKALIGEAMGVQVAVTAMLEHLQDSHVVENGAGALNLLSLEENNRDLINAAGGVQVLLKVMRAHRFNKGVQEQACWALANLGCEEECRVVIGAEGGIETVANAMKDHGGEVSRIADIALRIFETAGGDIAQDVQRVRRGLQLEKRVIVTG